MKSSSTLTRVEIKLIRASGLNGYPSTGGVVS
jgi:hypothetical protein